MIRPAVRWSTMAVRGGVVILAVGLVAAAFPPERKTDPAPANVLLVGIGIHVEPFGAVVSDASGPAGGPAAPPPPPNYNDPAFYRAHLRDLRTIALLVGKYGGKLTLQVQTPFTKKTFELGERIFPEFELLGHEVALHFHEDAHLGPRCEEQPVSRWAAVMAEEVRWIVRANATSVRYWSGGNLYGGLLQAASAAGLEVMSDHKNPRQQTTDARLLGVNPLRPSGGPTESDLAAFAAHDPRGPVIYLPIGQFSSTNYANKAAMTDREYFAYLAGGLRDSAAAARPDRVNVYHITIHPGEFRGREGSRPYLEFESWLKYDLAPLVASGRARWATFSEMADAFKAWEAKHPGVNPRT